jgi:ribosomal protein L14
MTFYSIGRERKPMKRANGYPVRVKWNCCVVVPLVKDIVG